MKGCVLIMKAASGELGLTVITLIAIALVLGFFRFGLWNNVKSSINTQWNNTINGTKEQ